MIEINKLIVFKCLQLAIAALCLGFHYKSRSYDFDCDTVSITAYGGFIIISAGGLMGYLLDSPINKKVDIFFCWVGCAIYCAAGALNIDYFQYYTKSDWKHYGLAKGIISIVNGAIFLLNSIFSWRDH